MNKESMIQASCVPSTFESSTEQFSIELWINPQTSLASSHHPVMENDLNNGFLLHVAIQHHFVILKPKHSPGCLLPGFEDTLMICQLI
jgi:hypothetical protein